MAFNENSRVKIPAILHLNRLGYEYISLKNAKWDMQTNIFTDIFSESIKKINPGIEAEEIKRLLEEITLVLDNEDLGKDDFSVVVSYDQIKEKNYSLSAGQYFEVKIEYVDITAGEFAAKMKSYTENLDHMFAESHNLEKGIKKQLGGLWYE